MMKVTGIEDLPEDLLPGLLRDIKLFVGAEAAWRFLQAYSGVHIRVPKTLEPDHPLAISLGFQDAQRLCEIYGGEVLTVPRAMSAIRAWRDRIIYRQRGEGVDIRSIALAWQLTERRVYEILSEHEQRDGRQIDLFDAL